MFLRSEVGEQGGATKSKEVIAIVRQSHYKNDMELLAYKKIETEGRGKGLWGWWGGGGGGVGRLVMRFK